MNNAFIICMNADRNKEYGSEYLIDFINKLNIYENMESLNK